jgi:CheY-like chemotaxis protein
MDCEMPVLDGFEATREIRRLEAGTGRHVVIIAVTAHATADDRGRCVEAGMDDYIGKPFRSADLVGMLDTWLHAPAGSSPAAAARPHGSKR